MKGLIRGVACMVVALGVTACEDDPSLDFGGKPTGVQLSPFVYFANSGVEQAVRVRLVNDRNQSVPTQWVVSNVGAGLEVVFDSLFRPEQSSSSDTLRFVAEKVQQQYLVRSNIPTGGQRQFTLTSGAFSGTVTANIQPLVTGALSATAPALGDPVTITAPDGQSFTTTGTGATTVSFSIGGTQTNAIITSLTSTSVTFIPLPGSTGPATVTGITLNFAPTLAARTLVTSNEINVPAVASAPATVSAGGVNQPRTLTAAGFKFLPDFSMTVGGVNVIVLSVAADSNSAQVVVPAGVTAENPVLNNVVLDFLPEVPLNNLPSSVALTTATTPYDGSAPDGNALVINALDPIGTPLVIYDTPINFGADLMGLGGDTKYYKLVVPSDGVRGFNITWTLDDAGDEADYDFVVCTDPTDFGSCVIGSLTGSNPEADSGNLTTGDWWILIANFDNGPVGMITITID